MDASTLRIVENGLVPVYEGEDRQHSVNARELHGFLESGWDFSNWIQDRIAKYGFTEDLDFSKESLKTPTGGRPRVEYFLTLDCAKEIAMVENNDRGKQVRRYFIEVERRTKQATPVLTQTEVLLQTVQIMAEQERQLKAVQTVQAAQSEQLTTLGHRVDSLDLTNIEGTPRQRLVKMIQRYANQKGITYPAAWHAWDASYNTAYRTNITARRKNYAAANFLKQIDRPEYLERAGNIEDAIRVADKMLNSVAPAGKLQIVRPVVGQST